MKEEKKNKESDRLSSNAPKPGVNPILLERKLHKIVEILFSDEAQALKEIGQLSLDERNLALALIINIYDASLLQLGSHNEQLLTILLDGLHPQTQINALTRIRNADNAVIINKLLAKLQPTPPAENKQTNTHTTLVKLTSNEGRDFTVGTREYLISGVDFFYSYVLSPEIQVNAFIAIVKNFNLESAQYIFQKLKSVFEPGAFKIIEKYFENMKQKSKDALVNSFFAVDGIKFDNSIYDNLKVIVNDPKVSINFKAQIILKVIAHKENIELFKEYLRNLVQLNLLSNPSLIDLVVPRINDAIIRCCIKDIKRISLNCNLNKQQKLDNIKIVLAKLTKEEISNNMEDITAGINITDLYDDIEILLAERMSMEEPSKSEIKADPLQTTQNKPSASPSITLETKNSEKDQVRLDDKKIEIVITPPSGPSKIDPVDADIIKILQAIVNKNKLGIIQIIKTSSDQVELLTRIIDKESAIAKQLEIEDSTLLEYIFDHFDNDAFIESLGVEIFLELNPEVGKEVLDSIDEDIEEEPTDPDEIQKKEYFNKLVDIKNAKQKEIVTDSEASKSVKTVESKSSGVTTTSLGVNTVSTFSIVDGSRFSHFAGSFVPPKTDDEENQNAPSINKEF